MYFPYYSENLSCICRQWQAQTNENVYAKSRVSSSSPGFLAPAISNAAIVCIRGRFIEYAMCCVSHTECLQLVFTKLQILMVMEWHNLLALQQMLPSNFHAQLFILRAIFFDATICMNNNQSHIRTRSRNRGRGGGSAQDTPSDRVPLQSTVY